MGERVSKSFKEGYDRGKGRDVGGRSTGAERSDVDVATVATTKTYSNPWTERTGKQPVRSAEDH